MSKKKQKIHIVVSGGFSEEVEAEIYGHLALHKTIGSAAIKNKWTVTHPLTGLSFVKLRTKKNCVRFIRKFNKFPWDEFNQHITEISDLIREIAGYQSWIKDEQKWESK